jgi:hypothetical protein
MPFVPRKRSVFMKAALAAAGAAGVTAASLAFHPPAAAASGAPRQAAGRERSPTPARPESTPTTQQRRPTQCGPGLPPCPSN